MHLAAAKEALDFVVNESIIKPFPSTIYVAAGQSTTEMIDR